MIHFLAGLFFCLVDIDAYMFETNPFINFAGLGNSFKYIYFLYFSVIAYPSLMKPKPSSFRMLLWVVIFFIYIAALRLFADGFGWRAFLYTDFRHLLLAFAIIPLCFLQPLQSIKWLKPFAIGAIIALVVRAFLLLFFHYGSDVKFGEVTSRAFDGGYINLNAMASLFTLLFAYHKFLSAKRVQAILWLVLALLLYAVPVSSFRRMVLIRMFITIVLAFALHFYLQRNIIKGSLKILSLFIIMFLFTCVAYISFFGYHTSLERIQSLSFKSTEEKYAASNDSYLEHWHGLSAVFFKTFGCEVRHF